MVNIIKWHVAHGKTIAMRGGPATTMERILIFVQFDGKAESS